jgi:hypothetical protein
VASRCLFQSSIQTNPPGREKENYYDASQINSTSTSNCLLWAHAKSARGGSRDGPQHPGW